MKKTGKEKIDRMKEKYTLNYQGHFEVPFGLCYGDADDRLNLYYQEGLFPDEHVAPVRKINLLSLQEEKLELKNPGIQYIRWQRENLHATDSRKLVRFSGATDELKVIGKAGTGKDEYILPADFIFFDGDILLSDLYSNKILRYDHTGSVKDVYVMDPYSCPLAMKMIDEDTLVLALRSGPWSGIKRMLSREFHHLPETHNTQEDNLIVFNIKTRQVEPFGKRYNIQSINKTLTGERRVWDMEIDTPYLYFLTGYYQNVNLIKYDMAAQDMVFDYDISGSFRKGLFSDLIDLRQIELLRAFSLKILNVEDKKILLFYVNFLHKFSSPQYRTLCLKFGLNE